MKTPRSWTSRAIRFRICIPRAKWGGITSEHYQGGTNLAECIIFGQIAGKNAAAAKDALPEYTLAPKVESTPTKLGEVTDLNQATSYETKDNEYIGEGTGMGGKLVVKVTMDGDKIANVEIVEHSESENISDPAIEQLPKAIVEANGTEVDTISGRDGHFQSDHRSGQQRFSSGKISLSF